MKSLQETVWLRLGNRSNPVSLQDVADRLVRHNPPEIGQRTDDPIVSPAAILASHPNDERP